MPNEFANAQNAFTGICARSTDAENVVERVLPIRIRGHHALWRVTCNITDPSETIPKRIALTAVVLIRDHVCARGG